VRSPGGGGRGETYMAKETQRNPNGKPWETNHLGVGGGGQAPNAGESQNKRSRKKGERQVRTWAPLFVGKEGRPNR